MKLISPSGCVTGADHSRTAPLFAFGCCAEEGYDLGTQQAHGEILPMLVICLARE